MRWNRHSRLEGEHAFLSPSNYHWINYSLDRLTERWFTAQAAYQGQLQHEYAKREIEEGRLSEHRGTLGMFINDAIRFRMVPEQVLYYSENCFGTTDAICFRYRKLRIHDLKTGAIKGSVHQLEVYAALFCLEYDVDPYEIAIVLRIYQDNSVEEWEADPDDIRGIMDTIQIFDKELNTLRLEEGS